MKIEVNSKEVKNELTKFSNKFSKKLEQALLAAGKVIAKEESKRTKGNLSKSFSSTLTSNTSVAVDSDKHYAEFIENGRGAVFAKPGHFLKFEINGQTIFCKSVGPAKAQPFVQASIAASMSKIEEIFNKKFSEL